MNYEHVKNLFRLIVINQVFSLNKNKNKKLHTIRAVLKHLLQMKYTYRFITFISNRVCVLSMILWLWMNIFIFNLISCYCYVVFFCLLYLCVLRIIHRFYFSCERIELSLIIYFTIVKYQLVKCLRLNLDLSTKRCL